MTCYNNHHGPNAEIFKIFFCVCQRDGTIGLKRGSRETFCVLIRCQTLVSAKVKVTHCVNCQRAVSCRTKTVETVNFLVVC